MTSHFDKIEQQISDRLRANWSTTPILDDNLDDRHIREDSGEMPEAFIILEIVYLDSDIETIGAVGNNTYQTDGLIRIHILTPSGEGSGLSAEYMDSLAAIFRGVEFDDVICFAPKPNSSKYKTGEKGQYYVTVLETPFYSRQNF